MRNAETFRKLLFNFKFLAEIITTKKKKIITFIF